MMDLNSEARRVAAYDPRLALALLQGNPKFPQVLNMSFEFASGAVDQPVPGQLDSPITADTWIYEIGYQVQQPNLAPGSLIRGQQIYYNALNPNINLTMQVNGGTGLPWVFSPNPLPVEALASPLTGPSAGRRFGCCDSFLMFFPQVLKGSAWLTRTYLDQEVPTRLIVTLHGMVLGCQNMGSITDQQAREILNSEYKEQLAGIPLPVPKYPRRA